MISCQRLIVNMIVNIGHNNNKYLHTLIDKSNTYSQI